MKFLIIFLLIVVVSVQGLSLTPEQKAKAKKYQADCAQQTGVNTELVKKARKGIFVNDEKLKSFALCFFLKANLITPQGDLKEDVIMAKLPPGANKLGAKVVLEICKAQKGKTPADTAWNIYKCYYEATPNHVTLF